MDEELKQLHLDAGKASGEETTCLRWGKPKQRYGSEDQAAKAAAALNRSGKAHHTVEAYPCFWCSHWHIGREMALEELKLLSELQA